MIHAILVDRLKNLNDPTTSMAMLKNLVNGLNYQSIPNRSPTYFDENIVSIHFHPNMVFIFKGENKRVLSAYVQRVLEEAKQ